MNRILLLLANFIAFTQVVKGQSMDELCKKWNLNGYIYLGVSMLPDENEKHDFIHFKNDNSFTSIDEKKFERGTWKWDMVAQKIYLFNESSTKPLSLKLIELSKDLMIINRM